MLTKVSKLKAIAQLRVFVIISCILSGWLAGVNLERYLVRLPAWRKVDIQVWAEYSRQEYAVNGFHVHRLIALCSFSFLLISTILIISKGFRFVSWQVYLATLLSGFALIISYSISSVMTGLHGLGDDPVLLQHAFDRFHYLGAYRAVAQVLVFGCCIWAMGRCYVIRYVRV